MTITDQASRFILACEALESTKEAGVIPLFQRSFEAYGLPRAIRSDNGVPFASPNGLYGLSCLSVWWLRLGIAIERMHLTLKNRDHQTRQSQHPPAAGTLRRLRQ